jgi:hypothetical protein
VAFFKPTLVPGINKTDTSLASEGGWNDGNWMRFFQGNAQVVGGWQLTTPETFEGTARGSHTWTTLDAAPVLAFGTSTKLYAIIGGALQDITPYMSQSVETDIFTTVNASDQVTVHQDYHNLKVGDSVTFSNHQSTVGGLTVEGDYTVTSVTSRDKYVITHASNASSTVSTPGGGAVDVTVPLPAGNESRPPSGYGTGTYGSGTYGSSGVVQDARTWALGNFGENLMANPSGGGLYTWQPETVYSDLAVTGDFASSTGWATGTDWTIGSGVATKTAGTGANLSQSVADVLEGGRYYRVTFTVTRSAGTLKFRVNAGASPAVVDVGDASTAISKSGTYTRVFLCPAVPQDIVFEADSSFAGEVDNVSYQLEQRALRVTTAPPIMDSMYVNSNGVVVAIGTTQVDDSGYNPICVRNSGQGNFRDWTPDTASAASEFYLRNAGGQLIAGISTREQDLIWSIDGVFSAQFNSSNPLNGNAFSTRLLGKGCGLISRHAMIENGGFAFWMASSGKFFIFRGVGATNLGVPEQLICPVQEYVFENLNTGQAAKIFAWFNSTFSEVWFHYPDSRDGDECSRAVSCAFTEGNAPWSTHEIARTTGVGSGVFDFPILLSPEGFIYDHEQGKTANGAKIPWYITSSDFDVSEGDNIMHLRQFIPDFRDQEGTIKVDIASKLYPNASDLTSVTYNFTSATTKNDFRISGRQCRVTFTGLTAGAWARMGAMRFDVIPTGSRR